MFSAEYDMLLIGSFDDRSLADCICALSSSIHALHTRNSSAHGTINLNFFDACS
jgi:hypothetical protein